MRSRIARCQMVWMTLTLSLLFTLWITLHEKDNGKPGDALGLNKNGSLFQTSNRPTDLIEVVASLSWVGAESVAMTYPALLGSALNISHALVLTADSCLAGVCVETNLPLGDLYYGRNSVDTSRDSIIQRLDERAPAIVILEIGKNDLQALMIKNLSDHAFSKALRNLVVAYQAFVTTVRPTQHEYQNVQQQQSNTQRPDHSFIYNSMANELPVFLLTPLTTSPRLQRILAHFVSEVVRLIDAEGDKSTFWVDTDGWLGREDWELTADGSAEHIKESGHLKIATYLSWYICPYVKPQDECPYHKPSVYEGHLHLPDQIGMKRLLEERKLALIKEKLALAY